MHENFFLPACRYLFNGEPVLRHPYELRQLAVFSVLRHFCESRNPFPNRFRMLTFVSITTGY